MFERSTKEFTNQVLTEAINSTQIKKFFNKELRNWNKDVSNEFDPDPPPTILKPLEGEVLVNKPYGRRDEVIDLQPSIEKSLSHLSYTGELEFNSDRTRYLETFVQKMIAGEDIKQFRVVIMHKGEEPSAFVYPDGTIVISQSLINLLNEDEVLAVLAHEINHLINETYRHRIESNGYKDVGVAWLHEMVGDVITPVLLVRAGAKSSALATAIMKISPGSRGTAHQTGESRASEVTGTHLGIDFETSSQEMKQLPNFLHGEVKRSNLETANMLLNANLINELRELLPSLHRQDLLSFLLTVSHQSVNTNEKSYNDHRLVLASIMDLISVRLKESITDQEVHGLLFYINTFGDSIRNLQLINSVNELIIATDDVAMLTKERTNELFDILFNDPSFAILPPIVDFIKDLRQIMVYEGSKQDFEYYTKIPINRKALIHILKSINLENKNVNLGFGFDETMASLITDYFAKESKANGDKHLDPEKFVGLISELQDNDCKLPLTKILKDIDSKSKSDYSRLFPRDHWQIILKVYKNFLFKEKDESPTAHLVNVVRRQLENGLTNPDIETYALQLEFEKFRDEVTSLELTNEDKLQLMYGIDSVLDEYITEFPGNIRELLHSEADPDPFDARKSKPQTPGDTRENAELQKSRLKMAYAFLIFDDDTDEFYEYIENVIDNTKNITKDFSDEALICYIGPIVSISNDNKSMCIFKFSSYGRIELTETNNFYMKNVTKVTNFERFTNLPIIKDVLEKFVDFSQVSTIKELNLEIEKVLLRINAHIPSVNSNITSKNNIHFDMYSPDVLELYFGQTVRLKFFELIKNDLNPSDFGDVQHFVNNFFPRNDPMRSQILRLLDNKVLQSTELALEMKTQYLIDNFDRIGIEGMIVIGDQIKTFKEYEIFREKVESKIKTYLSGSKEISIMAGVDFLTSFIKDYDPLLETIKDDENSQNEATNNLAKKWASFYLNKKKSSGDSFYYDKELRQFTFRDKNAKFIFKSFPDVVDTLKSTSLSRRLAMVQKSLTEKDGALTSPENRKNLSSKVIAALKMKGFSAKVLEQALQVADAHLISLPISQSLSPLLFRALDTSKFDVSQVKHAEIAKDWFSLKSRLTGNGTSIELQTSYSDEEIERILTSSTRELMFFGANYRNIPDSALAKLSQESYRIYEDTVTTLLDILDEDSLNETADERDSSSEIDPSTEAVIGGVQATGALGVRSLQLATQFHTFSNEVSKRLSESLDSNEGLNKLLFWENLYQLRDRDPSVATYLENMEELLDYRGGGSLFTTFSAVFKTEDGKNVKRVLKMLNPNAQAFIGEMYGLAFSALENVSKSGTRKERKQAELALAIIDLANSWCIRDINDVHFIEDDSDFREVISEFNDVDQQIITVAPEVAYNSMKLKSEDEIEGRTLNKILQDPDVSLSIKKTLVEKHIKFFLHQMRTKKRFGDEQHALFHSDPHTGNYIVDINDAGNAEGFAVIDRSMYLRLSDKDLVIGENLLEGRYKDFLYNLIDRVLEHNKIRNSVDQKRIKAKIQYIVIQETVLGALDHERNGAYLLAKVMSGLSNSVVNGTNLEVPLSLRLLIRNVEAEKALATQFGVDLSSF